MSAGGIFGMVSQKLKTAMAPMKLYIEMILREDKSNNFDGLQNKGLKTVYKNIIKIETIINDVFTVYRVESDNFAFNIEVISVTELV